MTETVEPELPSIPDDWLSTDVPKATVTPAKQKPVFDFPAVKKSATSPPPDDRIGIKTLSVLLRASACVFGGLAIAAFGLAALVIYVASSKADDVTPVGAYYAAFSCGLTGLALAILALVPLVASELLLIARGVEAQLFVLTAMKDRDSN